MKRKYETVVVSKNGYARTLRIFAPKNAKKAIIMHDGQNVFYDDDAAYKMSFRAFDALKALGIKDIAIIGVDSMQTRMYDYVPFKAEIEGQNIGGGCKEYVDYITSGVLPYLDGRFGFTSYAMAGASAGATATLYYANGAGDRFKAFGLFSTPLFITQEGWDDFFKTAKLSQNAFYEVYVGGNEVTGDIHPELIPNLYVKSGCELITGLRALGVKNLRFTLENGGVHNEINWRAPFKRLLNEFEKV